MTKIKKLQFDKDRYEGEVDEFDNPNGQGTWYFSDGSKFVGTWKVDKETGLSHWDEGILIYHDGASYEGEWKDNKRNGKGTFIWPNGQKYVGEWYHHQINGNGKMFYDNGDV